MSSVEFLKEVLKRYPSISLAILFGSHARGQTSRFSDLDVLVEGEFDRDKLVDDIRKAIGKNVEVDLLEVQSTPIKLLKDALNEGVILKCKDEERLRNITHKVAVEYPESWMECVLNRDRLLALDCELKRERVLSLFTNFVARCNWLKKFLNEHSREEVLTSEGLQYEVKWPMFEAIQSLIDMCAGIASDLKLGVAESYKDYVDKLVERKVMPNDLGYKLKDFISFRNRLVHLYLGVKVEEMLTKAEELTELMSMVREWVKKLIEKEPR
jgi:uncharacterized protein YutE (UPF0331/DUF86 family)/predicted nucleotidyltransferase